MKRVRTVVPVVLFVLSAFALVTYTACREKLCANVVCQHEGSCEAGVCVCRFGYEGTLCENLMRDAFIGSWVGEDTCNTGNLTAALNIGAETTTDFNVILVLPNGVNNSGQQLTIPGVLTAADVVNVIAGTRASQYVIHNAVVFLDNTKRGLQFSYALSDTTAINDTIKCTGIYRLQ